MAQSQRRPEERRPSEVEVPRLSREEVERRAGNAYDSAMASVLRSHFRPPPVAEISAFRRMVEARVNAGENVDVGAVLNDYCRANPNSAIARYSRLFGGSTEWLLDEQAGRIGFRSAIFERLSREYLSVPRADVVAAFVTLSNPRNRDVPVSVSAFDSDVMAALAQQLSSQIRGGANQLAATIAFQRDEGRLLVATLLPPPAQDYDFGKKKG
jgi:hypothetical protein